MIEVKFANNKILYNSDKSELDIDKINNNDLFQLLNFCVKNEEKVVFKLDDKTATPSCIKMYEYIKNEFSKEKVD